MEPITPIYLRLGVVAENRGGCRERNVIRFEKKRVYTILSDEEVKMEGEIFGEPGSGFE